MKRPNLWRHWGHRNRIERKALRRQLRAIKRLRKKTIFLARIEAQRNSRNQVQTSQADLVLKAPEVFGLWRPETHTAITNFLGRLRDSVLIQGRSVCIDFTSTNQMIVDGTLLFFAELSRIVARRPGTVTCTESSTPLVNEVLQHLGLFKLMKSPCKIKPKHADAVAWSSHTGVVAELDKIGPVLEQTLRGNERLSSPIYKGVQEAVTNVPQHAYFRPREDGTGVEGESGWWMYLRVREGGAKAMIALCDLGLGIPGTLDRVADEERSFLARAKERVLAALGVSDHHDGTLILSAVESKRSRTGLGWRGRGLGQLRQAIESVGEGELFIFSNSGGYRFRRSASGTELEDVAGYDGSVFGTLVCWDVPLREVDDANTEG